MKLRYLFSIILSSVLLFAGCAKEDPTGYDNMQLSQTYLSIPLEGGSVSFTVNSDVAWEFIVEDHWPNVLTRDKNTNEVTKSVPSWLKADVMNGGAGKTTVTFSAEAAEAGREIEVKIKNGNLNQFVRVRQGSMETQSATCKEVLEGPDGKTYRIKGVCTSIENTTYGNWHINDGTGEVYIYGTLDSEGEEKNFVSWNLEVGDVVELEGPKTTYNGTTVELVNVTIIKIEKALLSLVEESDYVGKDGGEIEFKVAYKGSGVFTSVAKDFRDWISVVGMDYIAGVPSKLEPNPADTAIIKAVIAPNMGASRTGEISLSSKMTSFEDNEPEESSTYGTFKIIQDGARLTPTEGCWGFWAVTDNGSVAMAPLAANKTYGYLPTAGLVNDLPEGVNAFVINKVVDVEGGYTIQDISGRYYYQSGTYDSFNVSASLPADGYIWMFYAGENNTIKIVNKTTNKYIQYDTQYNSWGCYANDRGVMPNGHMILAPAIADGKYYIKIGDQVAEPLPANKSYGYLYLTEAAPENAFTFKYTEGKGYTISDASGRYYYMSGTYNSFNISAEPADGQYWVIDPLSDGTYRIKNLDKSKWWQFSTGYNSFGAYTTAQDGGVRPALVPAE